MVNLMPAEQSVFLATTLGANCCENGVASCGSNVVSSCGCEVVKKRCPKLASEHVVTRHGQKEVANLMHKQSSPQQCVTHF